MEMETVTEKTEEKEGRKEEKEGKEVSSKEEAETAEYSLLRQPTEDIYTETYFGNSTHQSQGQRKLRLLQAACVILSCVSLVLLLILIISSLKESSSCSHLEIDSSTCNTNCDNVMPQDCPHCQYCPDDWLQLDRSCFHFSTTRLNWDDSQRNCSALGASLVVISSSNVQNYLVDKGSLPYWIGLRKRNGRWTWVDNANLTTRFWSSSSPTGACAFLNAKTNDSKNWETATCTDNAYFICQLRI
ncbi:C-type lectin domain family 4 member E isoform X2 [Synchiropus splendidus]|uniref:C-type lectin domain family 4 member E isoform X2 n=1 Tax=Synchiropus splendidus TaxID=270530 RepID=UPI00237E1166|nr:C-type lectin domain family 4 member E isoform X2 [Synchiropus splendidus]